MDKIFEQKLLAIHRAAINARTVEVKARLRKVRTPEGAEKYGQAIGQVIVIDEVVDAAKKVVKPPNQRGVRQTSRQGTPQKQVGAARAQANAAARSVQNSKNAGGSRKKAFAPGRDPKAGVFPGNWTRAEVEHKIGADDIKRRIVEKEDLDEFVADIAKQFPDDKTLQNNAKADAEKLRNGEAAWILYDEDPHAAGSVFQTFVPDAAGSRTAGRPKGRWQVRQTKAHKSQAGKQKFQKLSAMRAAFDQLETIVSGDSPTNKRKRFAHTDPYAGAAAFMLHTGMRPASDIAGNKDESGEAIAIGTLNIQAKHIKRADTRTGAVTLRFPPGKGHKDSTGNRHWITVEYTNKDLAKLLVGWTQGKDANDYVFTRNGNLPIVYDDFRPKLREWSGVEEIKPKDIRTHVATDTTMRRIAAYFAEGGEPPKNKTQLNKLMKQMAMPAAQKLGHRNAKDQVTPTTTISSYIDPNVWIGLGGDPAWLPANIRNALD